MTRELETMPLADFTFTCLSWSLVITLLIATVASPLLWKFCHCVEATQLPDARRADPARGSDDCLISVLSN